MRKKIELLYGKESARTELIVTLMVSGALRVGERGLTTGNPGVYKMKNQRGGVK